MIVGEAALAHQLSRELFDEGVLATGIGFPTVPKGKARVRTIVTATHTRAELDRALEVFERVGKRLGIRRLNRPIGHPSRGAEASGPAALRCRWPQADW